MAEAEKRLKKLERDYLHAKEKLKTTQSHWHSFYWEALSNKGRCIQAGYDVNGFKRLVEILQNSLDKLTTVEATHKQTETTDHRLQVLMLHTCRSLAQEKMLLQQRKREREKVENDVPSQETIDFKRINCEFKYIHRSVTRNSSKRVIHELVREVKEAKKLRENAIAKGALMGELGSLNSLTKSMQNEIGLLNKVIRELEQERTKRDHILQDERTMNKDYAKKARNLEEKCEELCRRWDDEKKRVARARSGKQRDVVKT